jgi:hypothetical protein
MKCDVIDECRCYAYSDVSSPKKNQFCGVQRGAYIEACTPACCADGCPGETPNISPREPFKIITRFKKEKEINYYLFILVALSVLFLVYRT